MNGEQTEADMKNVVTLLREIAKWARLDGISKARDLLTQILKRDSEKLAYEYSDGRGSAEVGKASGVSDFAVRSYWKKWAALGLVVPSEKYKGRFERLFSLTELGFEIPVVRGAPPAPLQGTGEPQPEGESNVQR